MNDLKLTDSPEKPVDPSSFYQQAISRSKESADANDAHGAFNWLRQAEFIGTTVLKKSDLPEVTEGYVRLINRNCRQSRDLAVKCGNITREHQKWAYDLRTMASQLKTRLSGGDAALAARAVVVEGLAVQVFEQISRFRRGPNNLYAPKEVVDPVIDSLTAIMDNSALLGVDVGPKFGAGDDLLELARTAASNAQFSINFFNFLSDWDKALFYTERALQCLRQQVEMDRPAAGSQPELDDVHALLTTAELALKRKDYRPAVTALKDAHDQLTAFIANQ